MVAEERGDDRLKVGVGGVERVLLRDDLGVVEVAGHHAVERLVVSEVHLLHRRREPRRNAHALVATGQRLMGGLHQCDRIAQLRACKLAFLGVFRGREPECELGDPLREHALTTADVDGRGVALLGRDEAGEEAEGGDGKQAHEGEGHNELQSQPGGRSLGI